MPKLLDFRQAHQHNHTSHRKRERGVILTNQGWQKLQQAQQQLANDRNFGLRLTREYMSELSGLSLTTIARILKRQEAVDRQSLAQFLSAFGVELSAGDCSPPRLFQESGHNEPYHYRREAELAQLRQWVVAEQRQTVVGLHGIGKSFMAVRLALQIQIEFEIVVWRSLQNASSLDELTESILSFLLGLRDR
ncbi:hypothetical protein [Phormidesmis sp. 146-33]